MVLPYELVIPTPMPSLMLHGIHATTTFEKFPKFRCNGRQLNTIDEAAAICGMKRADFLRFCAVQTAEAVLRVIKEIPSDGDPEPDS